MVSSSSDGSIILTFLDRVGPADAVVSLGLDTQSRTTVSDMSRA